VISSRRRIFAWSAVMRTRPQGRNSSRVDRRPFDWPGSLSTAHDQSRT
jgi:hypothetical protein